MNVKYVLYWLVGFVLIVAATYWVVNSLTSSPNISKNVAVTLPLEEQSPSKKPLESSQGLGLGSVVPAGEGLKPHQSFKELKDNHPQNGVPDSKDKVNVLSEQLESALEGEQGLVPSPIDLVKEEDSLKRIQNELFKMITEDPANIDLEKLDGLLAELQEKGGGSGIIGGVSIPQLRKIVKQSNKILEISQHEGLAEGTDMLDALQQEVEILQELQKGLIITNE